MKPESVPCIFRSEIHVNASNEPLLTLLESSPEPDRLTYRHLLPMERAAFLSSLADAIRRHLRLSGRGLMRQDPRIVAVGEGREQSDGDPPANPHLLGPAPVSTDAVPRPTSPSSEFC